MKKRKQKNLLKIGILALKINYFKYLDNRSKFIASQIFRQKKLQKYIFKILEVNRTLNSLLTEFNNIGRKMYIRKTINRYFCTLRSYINYKIKLRRIQQKLFDRYNLFLKQKAFDSIIFNQQAQIQKTLFRKSLENIIIKFGFKKLKIAFFCSIQKKKAKKTLLAKLKVDYLMLKISKIFTCYRNELKTKTIEESFKQKLISKISISKNFQKLRKKIIYQKQKKIIANKKWVSRILIYFLGKCEIVERKNLYNNFKKQIFKAILSKSTITKKNLTYFRKKCLSKYFDQIRMMINLRKKTDRNVNEVKKNHEDRLKIKYIKKMSFLLRNNELLGLLSNNKNEYFKQKYLKKWVLKSKMVQTLKKITLLIEKLARIVVGQKFFECKKYFSNEFSKNVLNVKIKNNLFLTKKCFQIFKTAFKNRKMTENSQSQKRIIFSERFKESRLLKYFTFLKIFVKNSSNQKNLMSTVNESTKKKYFCYYINIFRKFLIQKLALENFKTMQNNKQLVQIFVNIRIIASLKKSFNKNFHKVEQNNKKKTKEIFLNKWKKVKKFSKNLKKIAKVLISIKKKKFSISLFAYLTKLNNFLQMFFEKKAILNRKLIFYRFCKNLKYQKFTRQIFDLISKKHTLFIKIQYFRKILQAFRISDDHLLITKQIHVLAIKFRLKFGFNILKTYISQKNILKNQIKKVESSIKLIKIRSIFNHFKKAFDINNQIKKIFFSQSLKLSNFFFKMWKKRLFQKKRLEEFKITSKSKIKSIFFNEWRFLLKLHANMNKEFLQMNDQMQYKLTENMVLKFSKIMTFQSEKEKKLMKNCLKSFKNYSIDKNKEKNNLKIISSAKVLNLMSFHLKFWRNEIIARFRKRRFNQYVKLLDELLIKSENEMICSAFSVLKMNFLEKRVKSFLFERLTTFIKNAYFRKTFFCLKDLIFKQKSINLLVTFFHKFLLRKSLNSIKNNNFEKKRAFDKISLMCNVFNHFFEQNFRYDVEKMFKFFKELQKKQSILKTKNRQNINKITFKVFAENWKNIILLKKRVKTKNEKYLVFIFLNIWKTQCKKSQNEKIFFNQNKFVFNFFKHWKNKWENSIWKKRNMTEVLEKYRVLMIKRTFFRFCKQKSIKFSTNQFFLIFLHDIFLKIKQKQQLIVFSKFEQTHCYDIILETETNQKDSLIFLDNQHHEQIVDNKNINLIKHFRRLIKICSDLKKKIREKENDFKVRRAKRLKTIIFVQMKNILISKKNFKNFMIKIDKILEKSLKIRFSFDVLINFDLKIKFFEKITKLITKNSIKNAFDMILFQEQINSSKSIIKFRQKWIFTSFLRIIEVSACISTSKLFKIKRKVNKNRYFYQPSKII